MIRISKAKTRTTSVERGGKLLRVNQSAVVSTRRECDFYRINQSSINGPANQQKNPDVDNSGMILDSLGNETLQLQKSTNDNS